MAPPLPEPAQPATPTARTIIVIIAIFIGTSCFGRGGERGLVRGDAGNPKCTHQSGKSIFAYCCDWSGFALIFSWPLSAPPLCADGLVALALSNAKRRLKWKALIEFRARRLVRRYLLQQQPGLLSLRWSRRHALRRPVLCHARAEPRWAYLLHEGRRRYRRGQEQQEGRDALASRQWAAKAFYRPGNIDRCSLFDAYFPLGRLTTGFWWMMPLI